MSSAAVDQEQVPAEITMEQVETDLAWQREFSHLTTQLAQEFPRAFAGSHIDSETPEAATVGFVGTPPAEAVKRIEAFEGATITVLSNRPWTKEQLDRRLATAHQAAFARQDLVEAAVGHASYLDGSITLDVQPVDAAAARTGSAGVAEQIKDEISDPGLRTSVEVKGVESAEFTPESVVGGGRFEEAGESTLHCSAAFTVKHYTGQLGVVTAGHCQDTYLGGVIAS